MSEADKIIKNLKNSGKKVEEFYVSNKTSDQNVANIEDVKVLKDLMEELKLEKQTALHNNEYGEYITECDVLDLYDKQILALQHILAELEQKDKRIQELDEQVKMLDEAYTGTIKESKKWFDIAHNSIPTQVVLDKIDELGISDEDINIRYVLQELLETK